MSNEKDANDPPTEDPEEPDESGVGTPDPTGNGEDARDDGARAPADDGVDEPDDTGDPASDEEAVADDPTDPDNSDEVWDDGIVVDDGPGPDDAGAGREEATGATSEGVTEANEGGDIDELGSSVEVEGADIDEDPDEDDLLGGLKIDTTAELEIPDRLVDQVIGQEHARDVIIKAAKQRRHVMMIGSPGTGKSMLAKAMSELLPKEELQDVLVYHNPDDGNKPKVRTVPAGKGDQIVDAHREEARKRNQMRSLLMWIIIAVVLGYALIIVGQILVGIIAAGVVYLVFRYLNRGSDAMIPNLLVNNGDTKTAPFRDATGAHAGALLGDVRHDPFQSGGMETPSHDRVEAGAIHKANKGVLFIDEINTLDIRSQQHLMTAIQEGEFSITGQSERSSGAMVQTEPVPTDFVMIAAGNLDAMENMHPALRSRTP